MTAQRLGIPSCPRPASRFPQPAVAAYRCGPSASAPEEADAVNSLQPLVSADLEQPQNRQGTSVFLLLPRQMSTIFSQLYLLCFQSSAARPHESCKQLSPEGQPSHQKRISVNKLADQESSAVSRRKSRLE